MLARVVRESDLVAESDCDGASARIVLALSLVESASSWSRFLCAGQTNNESRQGEEGGGGSGAAIDGRGRGGRARMRHLEGGEVRAVGGGLLEELGGGVEELRPASAHLRVSSPAAAPAGADAGHRRRRWRFSWGVCAPAPRSSWGFGVGRRGAVGKMAWARSSLLDAFMLTLSASSRRSVAHTWAALWQGPFTGVTIRKKIR
jgi:hypothetical protein